MIKYFRKITSLNNLRRNPHKTAKKPMQISVGKICDNLRKGQIATLLTLVMVVILVLILVTVNIGNTSLKATTLSNAADAGVLQLASQLSTASRQMWKSLADEGEEGSLDSCEKGGMLAVFLAAISAIVAVVITLVTWGGASPLAVMAIGAFAGAIGALQGGLIAGFKGPQLWNQVILGASIGAAIGSCGSLVAGGLGTAGSTTVATGTTETVIVEVGATTEVIVETGATANIILETGATANITAAAGATANITASAGSTVSITASAGSTVSVMAETGATVSVMAETGATVSVMAEPGAIVAAEGAAVVKTGTTVGNIIRAIVKGYQAVNNFIGKILSLPGKALSWLASKAGLGSATKWLAAPLAKELAIGEALAMVVSGGSSIYKETVQQKMMSDVMISFSNALNSLSDRDAYRESTFLTVLSQTVDDPNMTVDEFDSDGDGDTEEMISYFQYWWDERIKALKVATAEEFILVKGLLSGDIPVFQGFLQSNAIPNLNRIEIEGGDGPIVKLCRALEDAPDINGNPIDVNFWEEGPTLGQWEAWLAVPCGEEGCGDPPPGFDETDYTINKFTDFLDVAVAFGGQNQGPITASWRSWFGWFYNPEPLNLEEDGSYYITFGRILYGSSDPGNEFLGLVDWQDEISNIRDMLPYCVYDDEGTITNAPCKSPDGAYATIDENPDDEFVDVAVKIQDMIVELDTFRNTLSNLYGGIQTSSNNVNIVQFGGLNPVVYSWSDSLGEHSVTVETAFKEPNTEPTETGGWFVNEKCIHLRDHSDDGTNTWVKVKRVDPDEAQVGILGLWKAGPIERTSHAAYSYNANSVRLVE